jgi:hypothetical protein
VGFAAFGSAGPTLMGWAMIMVLPIVPVGLGRLEHQLLLGRLEGDVEAALVAARG